MTKAGRETMKILAAYDLTACARSAADLAGCDPKPIPPGPQARRRWCPARRATARLAYPFLDRIENSLTARRAGAGRQGALRRCQCPVVIAGFGRVRLTCRRGSPPSSPGSWPPPGLTRRDPRPEAGTAVGTVTAARPRRPTSRDNQRWRGRHADHMPPAETPTGSFRSPDLQ